MRQGPPRAPYTNEHGLAWHPHPALYAIGLVACDGRHEKANRGKAQRQKTTLDGLL